MFTTTHSHTEMPGGAESAHRPAGFSDARAHDLLVDLCRIGPAPARSRELFTLAVTFVLLTLVIYLVRPPAVVIAGIVALSTLWAAVRWTVGTRKWDRR